MRVLRFRREPEFDSRTARLRTYAFLFAFFSILAARQAAERREASAAEAATMKRRDEHRSSLRLSAWRSDAGVEVAIVSSLSRSARVLVAVKELAGPWSPVRACVEVPPGGVRVTLPRALGERVFLLEPGPLPSHADVDGEPLPEARQPRVLADAGVQRGVGLELDADGRFCWRPRRPRLIAIAPEGRWALEGPEAGPLPRGGDPALSDALRAWRARPDLVWRRIGPSTPLRGRSLTGSSGEGLRPLVVWASLRLDGPGPRAEPLQLLPLRALPRWGGDASAVGPGP